MLCGSLVRAMAMLIEQRDILSEWKVPEEWTAVASRPLEFEQYLRGKWGTDLGSLVLSMPADQIRWWNYKEAAPEQFDCYSKQLVRVPNVSWEPIDKLPTFEFLLPGDNLADSFYETLHEVIYISFIKKTCQILYFLNLFITLYEYLPSYNIRFDIYHC
jgi:hypothetical protein